MFTKLKNKAEHVKVEKSKHHLHFKVKSKQSGINSLLGQLKQHRRNPDADEKSLEAVVKLGREVISRITLNKIVDFQLQVQDSITSTGAGALTNIFYRNTNVSGSGDWASLASLFDEFRIATVSVCYVPNDRYGVNVSGAGLPYTKASGLYCGLPMIAAYDHDSIVGQTWANIQDYVDAMVIFEMNDMHPRWIHFHQPLTPDEGTNSPGGWNDCANVANISGTLIHNIPAATILNGVFGTIFIRYSCQFRQRR